MSASLFCCVNLSCLFSPFPSVLSAAGKTLHLRVFSWIFIYLFINIVIILVKQRLSIATYITGRECLVAPGHSAAVYKSFEKQFNSAMPFYAFLGKLLSIFFLIIRMHFIWSGTEMWQRVKWNRVWLPTQIHTVNAEGLVLLEEKKYTTKKMIYYKTLLESVWQLNKAKKNNR